MILYDLIVLIEEEKFSEATKFLSKNKEYIPDIREYITERGPSLYYFNKWEAFFENLKEKKITEKCPGDVTFIFRDYLFE